MRQGRSDPAIFLRLYLFRGGLFPRPPPEGLPVVEGPFSGRGLDMSVSYVWFQFILIWKFDVYFASDRETDLIDPREFCDEIGRTGAGLNPAEGYSKKRDRHFLFVSLGLHPAPSLGWESPASSRGAMEQARLQLRCQISSHFSEFGTQLCETIKSSVGSHDRLLCCQRSWTH